MGRLLPIAIVMVLDASCANETAVSAEPITPTPNDATPTVSLASAPSGSAIDPSELEGRILFGRGLARPIAIGTAVLLVLFAGALPFMTPAGTGEALPIEPVVWLLGAAGVGLLTLVIKPYRSG